MFEGGRVCSLKNVMNLNDRVVDSIVSKHLPNDSHSEDMEKLKDLESDVKHHHGINVITACLFIVGEIAGTGILAFPESFKGMGWFGAVVIFFGCIGACYAGVVLGKSWLILEERDPYLATTKTRDPYTVIGYSACGTIGRRWTTVTLIMMLFGSSCVQELVFAETMSSLIPDTELCFCEWIIIVGICLMPFSFLGSPVDFWPVAFFAMSSTSLACILIIIAIVTDDGQTLEEASSNVISNTSFTEPLAFEEPRSFITFKSVMLGISTIIFGYGGASVLPTIQNDMLDKKQFTKSIVSAFTLMLLLYLPVSSIGYWKFGAGVKANIIRNLEPSILVTCIEVLILGHVFCAFLIQINPVNLTLETLLGIPHSFNWKRCMSRTFIIFLSIMTGLTVPKFGKLLNFLGAFSVSLQSFVLPALFYAKLKQSEKTSWYKTLRECSITNLSLFLVAAFGIFIAFVSTIYSLIDLIHPDAFTQPCFMNACVKLD